MRAKVGEKIAHRGLGGPWVCARGRLVGGRGGARVRLEVVFWGLSRSDRRCAEMYGEWDFWGGVGVDFCERRIGSEIRLRRRAD